MNFEFQNFLTLEFKLQLLFATSIQIRSKVSNWVFNLKGILNSFLKATQLCKVCKIKYRHNLASCACSQHTLWTKISLHIQYCKTKKQWLSMPNLLNGMVSWTVLIKWFNQIWLAGRKRRNIHNSSPKNLAPYAAMINQITQLRINTEINKYGLQPT